MCGLKFLSFAKPLRALEAFDGGLVEEYRVVLRHATEPVSDHVCSELRLTRLHRCLEHAALVLGSQLPAVAGPDRLVPGRTLPVPGRCRVCVRHWVVQLRLRSSVHTRVPAWQYLHGRGERWPLNLLRQCELSAQRRRKSEGWLLVIDLYGHFGRRRPSGVLSWVVHPDRGARCESRLRRRLL